LHLYNSYASCLAADKNPLFADYFSPIADIFAPFNLKLQKTAGICFANNPMLFVPFSVLTKTGKVMQPRHNDS
jgi:hypothetical protein